MSIDDRNLGDVFDFFKKMLRRVGIYKDANPRIRRSDEVAVVSVRTVRVDLFENHLIEDSRFDRMRVGFDFIFEIIP